MERGEEGEEVQVLQEEEGEEGERFVSWGWEGEKEEVIEIAKAMGGDWSGFGDA